MRTWKKFVGACSSVPLILALTSAPSRAQAPIRPGTPPEISAPVGTSTAAPAPVDPPGRRIGATSTREAARRSGDPVEVRKKRVAAARKALAELDRRINVEPPRTLAAGPAGRASGHLLASSNTQGPRWDPYATTAPAQARPAAAAAAGPRREGAVVRAGASSVRPSRPMAPRGRDAGVSRAVIPPPSTLAKAARGQAARVPLPTLPAAAPDGTAPRR